LSFFTRNANYSGGFNGNKRLAFFLKDATSEGKAAANATDRPYCIFFTAENGKSERKTMTRTLRNRIVFTVTDTLDVCPKNLKHAASLFFLKNPSSLLYY
jgi:hypothetical protein